MKRNVLILIYFVISLISSIKLTAQDIDTVYSGKFPRTVIEEYTLKSSVLLKREFIDIGTTNKLTVKVLNLTNMSNEITVSGIKFSWVVSSFGSSSFYPRSSFMDKDEIDDLSNSIFKMTTTLNQNPPINYTEYNFITKSGFEVGIFSQGQTKPWRAYVQNEYRNSQIFFNANELQKLQQLLQMAKSKL